MQETPLAAMGVVVEWVSSLLLCLLFARLHQAQLAHPLRLWRAAWAVRLVALSGSLVHAASVLLGDQSFGAGAVAWLDLFTIPGTLLFFLLIALAALRSVGVQLGASAILRATMMVLAVALGVALIDVPVLTALVLMAGVFGALLGVAPVVAGRERRLRAGRFPLLAAAMVLFGAVTLAYQLGGQFGSKLGSLDNFSAMIGWSAGYGGALVAALLGGALVVLMIDGAPVVAAGDRAPLPSSQRPASIAPRPSVEARAAAPQPGPTPVPVVTAPQDVPVRVPLARIPEAEAPVAPALPVRTRTATLPRPPRRVDGRAAEVFLIDDEASVRATLARIFQRGGWSVRDASTGEEGLAWLLDVPREAAPAIILCDLRMMGMGGREVHTHLLRDRPELVSRMIFITGDAVSEASDGFLLGTSSPVVEKPFTVGEIARVVERVLTSASG